jgi:hypothetical protein
MPEMNGIELLIRIPEKKCQFLRQIETGCLHNYRIIIIGY